MVTRILVNGRFVTRSPTGVDRFAEEVLRAWLPLYCGGRSVTMVVPSGSRPDKPRAGGLPIKPIGFLGGHIWEQLELPGHCGEDLLLSLCNTGPMLQERQLVVLHDASVMDNPLAFSFAFRTWYRWLFAGLMKRAGVVATVSKFSASELMRHFGFRARKIEIIYESGEHVLRTESDTSILKRLGLVDQRYVLAVGSRTPNKNFGNVVKAAAMLSDMGVKIVAAGGSNSRIFAGVSLTDPNLTLAGYVTDGELRALYENAQCFVFPSFYEGFGLPPLEAMHCGCPVVVSRRASLPEVCGNAAAYFDPFDPVDIALQLRRVLSSDALRNDLREAGLERVRAFRWNSAAAQLEQIIINKFK